MENKCEGCINERLCCDPRPISCHDWLELMEKKLGDKFEAVAFAEESEELFQKCDQECNLEITLGLKVSPMKVRTNKQYRKFQLEEGI